MDLCDKVEFLDLVRDWSQGGVGPLFVGSANLDHVHHFGRTPLDSSWVTLLDGAPLTWTAAFLTRRWWPRLAGSDLVYDLLRLAEVEGLRVGFLGGRAEVHLLAREAICARFPSLAEPMFWAPSRSDLASPDMCEIIAREIGSSDVQILFVCLGKPRQEDWMQSYGQVAGSPVQLAFGASVDFLAGVVPRAPSWMRSVGLEWGFRLLREPKRLGRRYLIQGPPALGRLLLLSHR